MIWQSFFFMIFPRSLSRLNDAYQFKLINNKFKILTFSRLTRLAMLR